MNGLNGSAGRGGGWVGRAGIAAAAAVAPASWGTTYLVTTQMLPEGRPMLAAAIRVLPAGLLLLALGRKLPKGIWWWRAIVLGMLNIGFFSPLIFIGAYHLPGGVAATIGALQPLLVTGFSIGLLGVRPGLRPIMAGVIGAAGVALLVLKAGAKLDTTGIVAMVAATVLMSVGTVLTRRWGRPEGVTLVDMTAWQLTVGGIFLAPLAAFTEGMPPALTGRNVIGFAYLVLIGTALAYFLWFRGIQKLGAGPASFLGLINPLVATVGGILVLNQTLTGWQVLGLVLALGAMVAGQGKAAKPATAAAEPGTGDDAEQAAANPDSPATLTSSTALAVSATLAASATLTASAATEPTETTKLPQLAAEA
ncbi:EamA family transporter [Kitasatospora acidiphila]|uniref:EamA family transporter n=1 Tax=Kitasatospora acidiphila TaxID=2567942 RepID=UPI003C75CDC4